jgi:hypothetical protein
MNSCAELNHLQTGRYGEYFAKMALARAGFDVFNAKVDDNGIDFVLRIDGDVPRYYDDVPLALAGYRPPGPGGASRGSEERCACSASWRSSSSG